MGAGWKEEVEGDGFPDRKGGRRRGWEQSK